MLNSLEQLSKLELKANFTPPERKYFDKLLDELEAIAGGVSIEELTKPSDAAQAGRILAKLEEIWKFVQDREIKKIEVVDEDSFMEWSQSFGLDKNWAEKAIVDRFKFSIDGVICDRGLSLCGTAIAYLPDDLKVGGDLYLSRCTSLTTLPDGLKVGGDLDLDGCTALLALPDNLQVGGSLNLKGCRALTTLPDNLELKRSLNLSDCISFTALPDNLHLIGNLNLRGCKNFTTLPDNLYVFDYLDLTDCISLVALPDDLKVRGKLLLRGCSPEVIQQAKQLKSRGQINEVVVGK